MTMIINTIMFPYSFSRTIIFIAFYVFYLGITTTNALSMGSEGGHEVGGWEEAVLVSIHDTESLLELLDGRVGEGLEDIGFLRHLGLCEWPLCNTKFWVTIISSFTHHHPSNNPFLAQIKRQSDCCPCLVLLITGSLWPGSGLWKLVTVLTHPLSPAPEFWPAASCLLTMCREPSPAFHDPASCWPELPGCSVSGLAEASLSLWTMAPTQIAAAQIKLIKLTAIYLSTIR